MARPRKDLSMRVLRRAYLDMGMSTTEMSVASKRLFGIHVTPATIYNHLVRLGIPLRTKSESISKSLRSKPVIKLTDVAARKRTNSRWNTRYWNARWLVSTGRVKATKSMLTREQADLLAKLLDKHGDDNALPEEMVEREFVLARNSGFPYIVLDDESARKAWLTLCKARPRKRDGIYYWVGQQTTLATMFHPHIYECRKNGKMSPMELFKSDNDLKRAIRKALCLGGGKITLRTLNDICRNEDAAGRVGNFPPRVGKAIIAELCGEDSRPAVLDPCAGFGGRMLACASHGASRYVGIDLSTRTCDGLRKEAEFLRSMGCGMEIEIRHGDCIEEMRTIKGMFDMIMTSPPFFDVEEYHGVPLPMNYSKWLSSFVEPMFKNCAALLKAGGKMAMYIERANGHDLPKDCARLAAANGLSACNPIPFAMNFGASRRRNDRLINILVWKKRD